MTERITAQQFTEAEGTGDWRVLAWGASAFFRTGSFATGVALVDAIGSLADAANHHPDVDLRYGGVTVRLMTHEAPPLSDRDLALARQISAAARQLDVAADPAAVQDIGLAIDIGRSDVKAFWSAVLGYATFGDEDLVDPGGRWPSIWFQEMSLPRHERNRIHIDVFLPHDQARARIDAALAAGGRMVRDRGPAWWTLADPEGNEVDVATWQGRD